jgi:hypothetical protein
LRAKTEEEGRHELWPMDAKPRARDRGGRRTRSSDSSMQRSEEPGSEGGQDARLGLGRGGQECGHTDGAPQRDSMCIHVQWAENVLIVGSC